MGACSIEVGVMTSDMRDALAIDIYQLQRFHTRAFDQALSGYPNPKMRSVHAPLLPSSLSMCVMPVFQQNKRRVASIKALLRIAVRREKRNVRRGKREEADGEWVYIWGGLEEEPEEEEGRRGRKGMGWNGKDTRPRGGGRGVHTVMRVSRHHGVSLALGLFSLSS